MWLLWFVHNLSRVFWILRFISREGLVMRIRTILNGIIGITVVILVGCGGGGGGGGSTPPPSGATLGGTAAKGIIKGGNVVAEELKSDGTVLAQVGTATTGADGSYSLTLGSSYSGGPVQVTISADANTEMKCDVPAGCGATVSFGDWYKPGAGNLTMRALVSDAATGATIGVNITPYTDLATRRAKLSTTLDASAVNIANSEVSNLLGGIDILNIKPLDITDSTVRASGSAAQKAYAAFSAAIGILADSSSGSPDINAALDTLETSFSGGVIVADDTGAETGNFSLQEIINGANSTLAQAGTADTSGTVAALQDDVDTATGNVVDPVADSHAGDAPLDKVKAFVADVRTWGTVIEAEMKTKGDAFGQQVDLASSAADMSQQFLVGPAFDGALDAVMQNFDGTNTSANLIDYTLAGVPQFSSGTIANTTGGITISNGVINGTTVNLVVQLPEDGLTASSFTLGITSGSLTSAASDVVITSGSITFATASPYTVNWTNIDAGTAAAPDVSSGSINLDVALTQKQDDVGADLVSPVTFAGNIALSLTNPTHDTDGNINWITPSALTLAGNVSTTAGESLDASLTVDVTNADSFVPVGELPVGHVKNNIVSWNYSGNTYTAVAPEATVTITWNSGDGSAIVSQAYSGGYSYTNTFLGPYADLASAVIGTYIYTPLYYYQNGGTIWVKDEGEYTVDLTGADFSVNGTANGILQYPDFVVEANATNKWLDVTVGLNFALQLDGLPEASINISGDRTAFDAGDATLSIAYGTRQIVIDGSFSDSSSTGGVTITNQNGVTMTIDGDFDAATGTVKLNGQSYATISQTTAGITKITYSDGTFETL
jgi:hypothetical protein